MEGHSSKKGKTSEYDDDRISQLPGNVLNVVFSHLTMREAVRTSVLSTKWRYLWSKSLSHLILDVHSMLDRQEYSSVDTLCESRIHKLIVPWKRMINFLNSVHQFLLSLGKDHKIEKLKVCFTFFRNKYGSHLDHWICFAIRRCVEELDLALLEVDYLNFPLDGTIYDFPCDLLTYDRTGSGIKSSLKCLRLAHCNLAPKYTNLVGFNTLTILDLKWVDLESNECVNNLLSTCRALEWLSLHECYHLNSLKIVHPLCIRLKYLNVCDCCDLNIIEFNGINLEKFEYKGDQISFVFNEVSQLKTVSSHVVQGRTDEGVASILSTLASELPQLKSLLLSCSFYEEAERVPETFYCLKLLSIIEIATNSCNLRQVATLLKASPSLQRLELHLHRYEIMEELVITGAFGCSSMREVKRLPRCPHEHLKEVVITGACGHFGEIEIAIYLLNNATVLEKMVIDPRSRYYVGDGKWEISRSCGSWMLIGRKRFLEYLTREASSQTLIDDIVTIY
ncbi:F-box/FBD/LRR-repeat protein [Actinidia chinensis var. chinensis]|uniref:F-box/FBD/LRR-repeat protein n=1 Tax=Actinidia chinensis var. chinensis TaxID=1590841 RepID=A0A2R6RFC6_ACTCC|nr:F-box/FBD/LRR-repeat protein [Actinidia chinensis var. chinensis]